MAKVHKYGTHDGIKYNPRRSIFRICIICGNPFFNIPPRSRKMTCSRGCSKLHKLELTKKSDANRIRDPISDALAQKKYYESHPEIRKFKKSRYNYSRSISDINGWDNYDKHHMIPASLIPEFAFEEWNIIPISNELHKKFHSKTGGSRCAKYPRWWSNELVNFIYDELHNIE